MANGMMENEIVDTVSEMNKHAIAITIDHRPSIKRAWVTKAYPKRFTKILKPVCVIGCMLGILSFVLSGVSFIKGSSTNDIEIILFGDTKFPRHKFENGVLNTLLEKLETNQQNVQELVQWANGSTCISGSGFKYKNYCYRFGGRSVKYEIAESYCKQRGGWLIYFEDEHEMTAVLEHLWSLGYDRTNELWVGMKLENGLWKYSNNEPATFVKWARGNIFDDGFNCAQIRTEQGDNKAGIYDRRCNDNQEFMCKFNTKL